MNCSDSKKTPLPQSGENRRNFLRKGLMAASVLAAGPTLWGSSPALGGSPRSARPTGMGNRISNIPNLADTLHEITVENDPATRMVVPRGFTVREVARSGQRAHPASPYLWHDDPDGGATFPMHDGGWVYVCNAEVSELRQGGVGALRFNKNGDIVSSYSICSGTTNNCAGGLTPWGTWLTCEEIDSGLVYECDPTGERLAVPLPALGVFKHEAAAVDPIGGCIYLTEDVEDGNFYRFVPDVYPSGGRADLRSGRLEAAIVEGDDPLSTRKVTWKKVNNPNPRITGDEDKRDTPTRYQVPGAAKFDGGEGAWYHDHIVYFTTKGDNRVWALDTSRDLLDLIYDKKTDGIFEPGIDDVDNITVSAGGDVIVAEDGADMRLVVVGKDVKPYELVNVIGQRDSEITGPAFSPDGNRLYFNSQNGVSGRADDGRTYEMRGPFFISADSDKEA